MPDPNIVLRGYCPAYGLRGAISVTAGRSFYASTVRTTLRGPLFLSKTIMFATLFTCFLLTVFGS